MGSSSQLPNNNTLSQPSPAPTSSPIKLSSSSSRKISLENPSSTSPSSLSSSIPNSPVVPPPPPTSPANLLLLARSRSPTLPPVPHSTPVTVHGVVETPSFPKSTHENKNGSPVLLGRRKAVDGGGSGSAVTGPKRSDSGAFPASSAQLGAHVSVKESSACRIQQGDVGRGETTGETTRRTSSHDVRQGVQVHSPPDSDAGSQQSPPPQTGEFTSSDSNPSSSSSDGFRSETSATTSISQRSNLSASLLSKHPSSTLTPTPTRSSSATILSTVLFNPSQNPPSSIPNSSRNTTTATTKVWKPLFPVSSAPSSPPTSPSRVDSRKQNHHQGIMNSNDPSQLVLNFARRPNMVARGSLGEGWARIASSSSSSPSPSHSPATSRSPSRSRSPVPKSPVIDSVPIPLSLVEMKGGDRRRKKNAPVKRDLSWEERRWSPANFSRKEKLASVRKSSLKGGGGSKSLDGHGSAEEEEEMLEEIHQCYHFGQFL
ncbi:hypothetical protein T439DRAFT_87669 [Meredithblackwellia eburnea MCA 4105]